MSARIPATKLAWSVCGLTLDLTVCEVTLTGHGSRAKHFVSLGVRFTKERGL